MSLTEDLIRRGYIPKEFIPAFKSESFADVYDAIDPTNLSRYGKYLSRCCLHSIPKLKQFRRIISLPNPLHQLSLAVAVEKHWALLSTRMESSTISLSSLEEDASGHSALRRKVGFDDLASERALRSTAGRFMVRADLSRFYQTLYTHSIPWALHTKEVAKSKKADKTLPGNAIDIAVRSTQDQQTLGIPVGPETSPALQYNTWTKLHHLPNGCRVA